MFWKCADKREQIVKAKLYKRAADANTNQRVSMGENLGGEKKKKKEKEKRSKPKRT